jgi:hypothetical protein
MSHREETIDRIPFKVNLPIVVTIISVTGGFCFAYFKLQAQITQANVGIAAILEKVSDTNADIAALKKNLEEHEKRLTTIEAKTR